MKRLLRALAHGWALVKAAHVWLSQPVLDLGHLTDDEPAERTCRECGCTYEQGCPGGCWWVGWDLCSACGLGLTMAGKTA